MCMVQAMQLDIYICAASHCSLAVANHKTPKMGGNEGPWDLEAAAPNTHTQENSTLCTSVHAHVRKGTMPVHLMGWSTDPGKDINTTTPSANWSRPPGSTSLRLALPRKQGKPIYCACTLDALRHCLSTRCGQTMGSNRRLWLGGRHGPRISRSREQDDRLVDGARLHAPLGRASTARVA